eukprot:scaffold7607_cov83-Cylindrotheca_fusiformis.AAC.1
MVQLHNLLDEDPQAAVGQVDEFGLTPLHILSLSQKSECVDKLAASCDLCWTPRPCHSLERLFWVHSHGLAMLE